MTSLEMENVNEIVRDLPRMRKLGQEILKDPEARGKEHAADIHEHFRQFASDGSGEAFRPRYFLRTDPLKTMTALFELAKGTDVESVPIAEEPFVLDEANGVVLVFQTSLADDNQPFGDSMWAQGADRPLSNPFFVAGG